MLNTSKLRNTGVRYLLNTVATGLLIILLLFLTETGILNKYTSTLIIQIGINIILAISLNLVAGYLGQLTLGHAGFMAIGAYVSALITLASELPASVEFPIAILVGGLIAGVFGVLIGIPALRLRGDYIAIITLGFSEIIRVIILNIKFPDYFAIAGLAGIGGAAGLRGIPNYTNVPWILALTTMTLFLIHALMRSRHGRAILSIREDEIASEAAGVSTTFYKVLAFALSAFFAGIAGAMYVHMLKIFDPSTFSFTKSTEILVIVVLGGMGSMIGSVVSATALTLLPELLRGFDSYRMVVYALLLVIVMIFKPSGLFGRYEFSLGPAIDSMFARIRAGLGKKKTKAAAEKEGGDAE